MKPKQVIVMRTDLKMDSGKMVAQGAHASLGALLKHASRNKVDDVYSWVVSFRENSAGEKWLHERFTKICVRVNSEEELLDIYQRATDAGLISCLIKDAGDTVFNGVPTLTCCAIGPAWDTDIDKITGHLKLLYK